MPETTTPSKPRHQSGFLAGAFAKLKQNLKRRLLRRSAVHQLRNTRVSLSRLIKTAQTFDATLNVGQEPTRYQYDELAKRKGSFCLDAVGPVTLEQIKRFLIDPVLPPATDDSARLAVISTYDYLRREFGNPPSENQFTDDQVLDLLREKSRVHDWLERS